MARKREGTYELRSDGWWARVTLTVDGKTKRPWVRCGTFDRERAKRIVAKLLKENAAGRLVATDSEPERDTCEEIAWPWNERREAEGVVMASDEATHLRDYILRELG